MITGLAAALAAAPVRLTAGARLRLSAFALRAFQPAVCGPQGVAASLSGTRCRHESQTSKLHPRDMQLQQLADPARRAMPQIAQRVDVGDRSENERRC